MNQKTVVAEAAHKYGIDPKILWGLYGTETSFGKNVSRSSAGAVGPFQFLPSTAKGMGVDPNDFRSAAFGAAKYLAQYKDRGVGGMLSAYNAGPAGGYQAGYVAKTLANAHDFGSGAISQDVHTQAQAHGVSPEVMQQLYTPETHSFDRAGFQKALARSRGSETTASLFSGKTAGDQALAKALRIPMPNPQNYESTEAPTFTSGPVIKTPTGSYFTPASSGYVHPLKSGTITSHDMGIDISAKPGTPIRAIGDSKVLNITPNWYAGQPYVELELLSGPRKGQTYYASEQITPQVHQGQFVRGGHAIGHVAPHGTALEFGWGSKQPGVTRAQASGQHKGEIGSRGTKAGEDFYNFVKGLR